MRAKRHILKKKVPTNSFIKNFIKSKVGWSLYGVTEVPISNVYHNAPNVPPKTCAIRYCAKNLCFLLRKAAIVIEELKYPPVTYPDSARARSKVAACMKSMAS